MYVTTSQLAKMLNKHPRTIRKWCENGLLTLEATKAHPFLWLIRFDDFTVIQTPKRGRPKGSKDIIPSVARRAARPYLRKLTARAQ